MDRGFHHAFCTVVISNHFTFYFCFFIVVVVVYFSFFCLSPCEAYSTFNWIHAILFIQNLCLIITILMCIVNDMTHDQKRLAQNHLFRTDLWIELRHHRSEVCWSFKYLEVQQFIDSNVSWCLIILFTPINWTILGNCCDFNWILIHFSISKGRLSKMEIPPKMAVLRLPYLTLGFEFYCHRWGFFRLFSRVSVNVQNNEERKSIIVKVTRNAVHITADDRYWCLRLIFNGY